MNLPKLSNRLLMTANLVNKCATVADIGTDHAYVPIYLIMSGLCESAIASDIKEGPCERARANINKYEKAFSGLSERIRVTQAFGLEAIDFDSTDVIVISGMGGEVIVEILKNACNLNENHDIILQPQTDLPLVREYVLQHGYEIVKEYTCTEKYRVYNAFLCKKTIKTQSLDLVSIEIGHINGIKTDIKAYFDKLRRQLTVERDGIVFGKNGDMNRVNYINLLLEELENEVKKYL